MKRLAEISDVSAATVLRQSLQLYEFVKTEKGYSLIGDWDMLEVRAGVEKNAFLKAVNKNYAYKKVMAEVKKKGYQIVEEKTDQHQTVQIRVRKFS